MRHALQLGQLAQADLVEDLAWLLITELVDLPALMARQEPQRAGRDGWSQRQCLHRGDHAVAAKRHGEPRNARGRDQIAVDVVDQQAQVLKRAAKQLVEQLVVGLDEGRG